MDAPSSTSNELLLDLTGHVHTTDILISKTPVADKSEEKRLCSQVKGNQTNISLVQMIKKLSSFPLVSTVSVGAKSHPVYLAIIHSIDYTCTKLTTHGKNLFDSSKPDMSLQRRPHSNCRNGTLSSSFNHSNCSRLKTESTELKNKITG